MISKLTSKPIAKTLGDVATHWLTPTDPLRQEAVAALKVSTGFTPAVIESAIDAAFSELTEEKISAFYALETGFTATAPDRVLHILAGNVFTAWLPGAVTTLLLGAECHLKPSSGEPVFAPLWRRSLEQVDPAYGQAIKIVSWDDSMASHYSAVVAYGSDETLSMLRTKIPEPVKFVGYGHKFSIMILGQEVLKEEYRSRLKEALRRDVAPFQLEGCLSPKVIFVEGEDPLFLRDLLSGIPVTPQLRRFDSWDALKQELKIFRRHLSAVGCSGLTAAQKEDLPGWGFSRVCKVGDMQRPPLSWRNGGFSLVDALTSR